MKGQATVTEDTLLRGKIPGEKIGIEVKKTVCGICSPQTHCGIDAYVKDGVVSMYHAYPTADDNTLIEPHYRDPVSGFPGFKSLLCKIRKVRK